MKAIYNGKLYSLVELENVTITMEDENGHRFDAPLDSDIIFDPTDDQINNILPDALDDKPNHAHDCAFQRINATVGECDCGLLDMEAQ